MVECPEVDARDSRDTRYKSTYRCRDA